MKKLFGWLKKLLILALVAVIIWIIYANRQQMAVPEGTTAAATDGENATMQTAETVDASATEQPSPESAGATAETGTPEDSAIPEVEETPVPETPATEQAAEVTEAPPAAEPPAEAEPAATESPTDTAAPATAEEHGGQSIDEARQAALMGEMEQAESAYLRIQKEQPDNYDAYGELGNLYLLQGKEGEAAEAYYQAALRLDQAGHRDEAIRLQRVVAKLNEELGTKLEQALTGEAPSPEQ